MERKNQMISSTLNTPSLVIKSCSYSPFGDPYVIAEIGVNHEGSLEKAKELIELAKKGGANAAKFQSYKASKLASIHSPSYWDLSKERIESQHELFSKYDHFSENEYVKLAQHCSDIGIDFLSTPFDLEAVDFLDHLMPLYKIASADITNLPLLRRIAKKQKPVILSTGASKVWEIALAIAELRKNGAQSIALLHCVLNYPTENQHANLNMIHELKHYFPECLIGYSDHTIPDKDMSVLTTAYLLGAGIIEKHFTDNKMLEGNDHYHAMDYQDLHLFCQKIREIKLIYGQFIGKDVLATEEIARLNARRSIVFSGDFPKGHIISEMDIIAKRPGTGISPLHWDEVIGRKLAVNVKSDQLLNWQMMS